MQLFKFLLQKTVKYTVLTVGGLFCVYTFVALIWALHFLMGGN